MDAHHQGQDGGAVKAEAAAMSEVPGAAADESAAGADPFGLDQFLEGGREAARRGAQASYLCACCTMRTKTACCRCSDVCTAPTHECVCASRTDEEAPFDESKMVWTPPQVQAMRRQGLLDCLDTVAAMVRTPWARSSALQTMDLVARASSKWCKCQQAQAQAITNAAKAARASVVRARLCFALVMHAVRSIARPGGDPRSPAECGHTTGVCDHWCLRVNGAHRLAAQLA